MAYSNYEIQQNTPEWIAIKVGKIGASDASELLMSKDTKGYQNLRNRLVEERITKVPSESKTFFGNSATQRGHDLEPVARDDFSGRMNYQVQTIGVIEYDDFLLCSPDGVINSDVLHQIKCPIFKTQVGYLEIVAKFHDTLEDNDVLQKIDSGYYKQCQLELYVSGAKIDIWTSYHPSLPPIDLFISRDEDMMAEFAARIAELKFEVEELIQKIKTL